MTHPASGIAEQDHPTTLHRPDDSPPRLRGVLVVDDEEAIRHTLGRGMRSHGFAVWLAADGPEAIELYRRHRDAIDVVLLDVQMRGRDGPATLAALQKIEPGVRCCFMTGDPGRYTERMLVALGAAMVFWKPFRLSEVAQQLVRLARPIDRHDEFPEDRWEDDGGGSPTTRPQSHRPGVTAGATLADAM